jgi:transposase
MASSMPFAVGVPGNCFLMTFRLGAPSITISGSGAARKWGKVRLGDCAEAERTKGFAVLPWRWRVERTFAWLCRNRRLRCDYERLPQTTEALIYVAMIRLMTRRLAAS